jgi:hypothetical protein
MSEAEPVNSVDSGLPPSKKKKVFNDELYDEEIVPLTRRRKANKSKMVAESRFCITTSPEVNKYKRRIIPEATQRANKWAVSIFDKWIEFRKNSGLNVPPHNILTSYDTNILCEWLCCFFAEVRKLDGTPYCPRTISSLLAGLRLIQAVSSNQPSLQPSVQSYVQSYVQPAVQPSIQFPLQPSVQSPLQPSVQYLLQPSLQSPLQPSADDALKKLKFQGMNSCTFNISVNYN